MINVDDLRKGFILDPNGERILPITHVNLVIGNDGESLTTTLDRITAAIDNINASGGILDVESYAQLQDLDTTKLRNGTICYVSNEDKYYSYNTIDGWKLMVTSSGGQTEVEDIYSHIWIGTDPPADDNMLWLDTNEDGIIEGEDDLNLLYSLRDKVSEMQTEIEILKNRVKYLEEHGVTVDPTPDPGTDEDDIILLEDGSSLLLEDGTELLLEVQSTPPVSEEYALLFEDGIQILLEDNTALLLE